MTLLERIFGIRKITSEQRIRLFKLRDSLMGAPTDNDSIKNYASNLGEYKQMLSRIYGKEAEEYRFMIPVFTGMLQRTLEERERKQRVKIRQ